MTNQIEQPDTNISLTEASPDKYLLYDVFMRTGMTPETFVVCPAYAPALLRLVGQ
jgi:hypothetical protein